VCGEFPVEADGSAYVELPALRSLQFVALDANGLSVKHMLSMVSVMPGETTGCTGCHEPRTQSPPWRMGKLMALARPPSKLAPTAGVPEIIDFPRDVQPVLDALCVRCHNADDLAGRTDLSGEQGCGRSFGFINLSRDGRASLNRTSAGNLAPRAYGSAASPVLKYFAEAHYGVKPSPTQRRLVQTWLDGGVTYRGAYSAAANRVGPGKADGLVATFCGGCHRQKAKPGQQAPVFGGFGDKSLIYNFRRPQKSIALRAPLAKGAGGLGWCRAADGQAVFASPQDKNYTEILAGIELGAGRFRAVDPYREMAGQAAEKLKLYGVLPDGFNANLRSHNVFDIERKYFRLFDVRLDEE
jgi:hypothetical protein